MSHTDEVARRKEVKTQETSVYLELPTVSLLPGDSRFDDIYPVSSLLVISPEIY